MAILVCSLVNVAMCCPDHQDADTNFVARVYSVRSSDKLVHLALCSRRNVDPWTWFDKEANKEGEKSRSSQWLCEAIDDMDALHD